MMECKDMGNMMDMMSEMMEGCSPEMMMEMMPKCLGGVLQKMPKDKRVEFMLKMVTVLTDQGCAGMSEKEKKDFMSKIIEKIG
jgi:hypothetical protein